MIVALVALVASVLGVAVFVNPAGASTPAYVVAGDDPNATGDQWGLHEAYFSDLRAVITDPGDFGATGIVNATFTIAAPRAVPLTTHSLDGIDVYFTSARDIASSEQPVLNAFVARGGTLIMNSNGPGFFDDTAWAGFKLSPRVVYGDGAYPYTTTHQAPSPSTVASGQSGHPIFSGPFGTVSTFWNWHTVAGFTSAPSNATVLSSATLTGPDNNGSSNFITISNVATFAVIPAGTISPGSGTIIATSDVDTFSNAYTYAVGTPSAIGYPTDSLCTLYGGTHNGTLARNTFAWIASQKASTPPPTTSTTSTSTTSTSTTSSTTSTTVRSDFGLVAAPSSVTVAAGANATTTITTSVLSGSAQTVSLAASGLPSGVTASFSPASVSSGSGSTLTLTATSGAASGTATVTVTGTAAAGTHTTNVSLTVLASVGGILNGGFETNSFTGWTTTGTSESVIATGCHSGAYCSRLGSSSANSGNSSAAQTFTDPTGKTSLSFYYQVVCLDTVTNDWATVTLNDNTTKRTTTILRRTCTNTGTWVKVSATVTAGHSYTLTLTNRDGNAAGNATYTLYDDVTLT